MTAKPGFALLLVMILVAVAVVLGVSYLTAASLKTCVADNYRSISRARYLAESGLEHAIYLLRDNPGQLDGTVANPLGPFYVDGTDDSYTISAQAVPGQPGQYTLSATGSVGNARRAASATVQRTAGSTIQISQALLVGNKDVGLPSALTVNGDIHVNAGINNEAYVNGNASATGTISDPYGRITGTKQGGAGAVTVPAITCDQYITYNLAGTDYQAVEFIGEDFENDNPLANGGAVTAENPGGVVHLTGGDEVKLKDNLNFTGTLIIDGGIKLDGANITLTAVEGFPAIVSSSEVKITDMTRNVTINGTVVAAEGMSIKKNDATASSSTTINGAVVCVTKRGYDGDLEGTHVLNYDEQRATLYNFSGSSSGSAQVVMLDWHD